MMDWNFRMRRLPVLAALPALALALAGCQGGSSARSAQVSPKALALASDERAAVCGMNQLHMIAASNTLKTHILPSKRNELLPHKAMFVRLVKEGGAGELDWFQEMRRRKTPEMKAAWKTVGARPSPLEEALKLGDPNLAADGVLAASEDLVKVGADCKREAEGRA